MDVNALSELIKLVLYSLYLNSFINIEIYLIYVCLLLHISWISRAQQLAGQQQRGHQDALLREKQSLMLVRQLVLHSLQVSIYFLL